MEERERAKLAIEVDENRCVKSSVEGNVILGVYGAATMLCRLSIYMRKDGVTREELRGGLLSTVGEYFDEIWEAEAEHERMH